MKYTVKEIYDLQESLNGKPVETSGWVKNSRSSSNFGFIELGDGTFFKPVQLVLERESLEGYETLANLPLYTAITAKGEFVRTEGAKQPFEIRVSSIDIEAESAADYPLQNKRHTFEYLREIAYLRPRSNTFSAVFRLRSILSYAIHRFFQEQGFVYVHTPIITASDAEGAGEMFRLTTLDMKAPPLDGQGQIDYSKDFFGKESFLTVSGQLQGEAYALAFQKIYTFGPTFRAENSNTARHAAEFWMIEPEIAFAGLNEDMDLAQNMLKYIIEYALTNAPEEMEFFNSFIDKGLISRLEGIVKADFAHITYTEAIEILMKAKSNFEYEPSWGIDLQTEHERYLTEEYAKKPVFVTDYPKEIKAFYMRANEDGKTVAAMDCLVPAIGEIVGGSQREERYDVLLARMKELGMHEDALDWYVSLRKYGGARHAGFGLGFERAIMYISGMKNIRDVIPFPRTVKNCKF